MRKIRSYQNGQALVLFLAFAAALIGIMLVAFNSGQVTNAKMRAMNATDAAAYSGAVWQARTLNFQAYMNRAMIVNEVAIAQSVSLRSWIDYLAEFVRNVSHIAKLYPPIYAAVQTAVRVLESVNNQVQTHLPPVEDALRTLSYLEHNAQKSFNGVGIVIAMDIANEIAKKNGAMLTLGDVALFEQNLESWVKFTETYDKNNRPSIGLKDDGRKRLREVALNSRDGFTRARDWSLNVFLGFRKQGGTDLIDYDSWKAMDSVAVSIGVPPVQLKFPLGWGGAQAYSTRMPVKKIGMHGDINDWNAIDGVLARDAAESKITANPLKFGSKLVDFPGYRDVQKFDAGEPKANMLPFAVEVVIKKSAIPSANSEFGAKAALTNGIMVEHAPHYVDNGGVYAIAEACVAFQRPFNHPRLDGAPEFPSLFNPYWRASLATDDFRSMALVKVVKGLFPMRVSGKGSCRV
ncbi:Tad domain-containing protein [Massilia aquatica]|uniref:Putative Flp pilus-assembly TadG-like N-terminal domain-containing protein n=1 Tax=Massilia aquatica TaxID=2609000 RepID=A0ABX0M670_9BURK|nr:Tad domain-containing protein [Massilia aquatica]NHZ39802.1 hypothetical protein [Massilia aquatica]